MNSWFLSLKDGPNGPDLKEEMKDSFDLFLKEDRVFSDVTTESLGISGKGLARIESRTKGVISGLRIVKFFLNYLKLDHEIIYEIQDGENVGPGDLIFSFKMDAKKILNLERIILNILSRCSSISTEVKRWTKISNNYNVKLLDTRKTSPGNRYLDKYAVMAGGGFNHRLNLEDEILIKENHLVFFKDLNSAIKEIRKSNKGSKIIVEIENMDQLREVVVLDVQRVILDNWDYEKISSAISLIKNKLNAQRQCSIEVEISGGVNFSNFESYCLLKPDFISVGAITNPKKSFDMSMLVEGQ